MMGLHVAGCDGRSFILGDGYVDSGAMAAVDLMVMISCALGCGWFACKYVLSGLVKVII